MFRNGIHGTDIGKIHYDSFISKMLQWIIHHIKMNPLHEQIGGHNNGISSIIQYRCIITNSLDGFLSSNGYTGRYPIDQAKFTEGADVSAWCLFFVTHKFSYFPTFKGGVRFWIGLNVIPQAIFWKW